MLQYFVANEGCYYIYYFFTAIRKSPDASEIT